MERSEAVDHVVIHYGGYRLTKTMGIPWIAGARAEAAGIKLADVERLAAAGESEDMELKKSAPSDRRIREKLLQLKRLGLVRQSGHGRGSIWALEKGDEE